MMSIDTGKKTSRSGELLCKHEGAEFACGLCNNCYKDVNSQPITYHFGYITICHYSYCVIAVHDTFWRS